MTSASDSSASYDYVYDDLGRATSIEHGLSCLTPTVAMAQAYDDAGRRTQLAVSSSDDFVNDYLYDNLGRMSAFRSMT